MCEIFVGVLLASCQFPRFEGYHLPQADAEALQELLCTSFSS